MVEVPVNVLVIEFSENGFPQFLALEIESGGTDGDLSKGCGILDGEYVDVLYGDWDDNGVHSVIDLNVVQSDVLVDGCDMVVEEVLDVVLG